MKRFQVLPLFLMFFALSPTTALSEVYRYTDNNGKSYYVSNKEDIPKQFRQSIHSSKDMPNIGKVPGFAGAASDPQHVSSRRRVKILVASWCSYCTALEEFLQSKRIPYKKYDIESDPIGKSLYRKHAGQGVPITIIGTTVIRGFQPKNIDSATRYE